MSAGPVIFLDFGGVLDSLASSIAYAGRRAYCPTAVALVERLAEETGARVVVTSSVRIDAPVGLLRDLLKFDGPQLARRIVGATPVMHCTRGLEILSWLATNTPPAGGRYVILDDGDDMLPEQAPHFVRTRWCDGFGMRDYLRALAILAPAHEHVTSLDRYAA